MKRAIPLLLPALLGVVLAGCASSPGGGSETITTEGGYGPPPGGYPTPPGNQTDSYGIGQPGAIQGQITGGPAATLEERVVYFDYDSAEVRAESRPIVQAHAGYLIDNPRAAVILEGHADEQGSREYNIGLGERRADAVRRLMGAMGVAPQQMRVVSYGEERPAVGGSDEESYSLNRRVEIVY